MATYPIAMPHVHRFYVPEGLDSGPEVALPPDEAHHALRVVRIRPGDRVALFDGKGVECIGTVASATKRDVVVTIETRRTAARPETQLTLLLAWLNREKCVEEAIRRCAEIGVDRFLFFRADRSERAPKPTDRWARVAVEACKQCGRLWLPDFACAPDLISAIEQTGCPVFIATNGLPGMPVRDAARHTALALAIGPEGDFSPRELEAVQARGAMAISLGEATFRSEVAAPLCASLVLYEWGRLGTIPSSQDA